MLPIRAALALPFDPLLHDLRRYDRGKLRRDLLAGISVAVVAVPQSMAYALIAGVEPVTGLYTAIVQGLIASLFTSSSHLSTGPINTLSLLVASSVARLSADPASYPMAVVAMTLLVGLVQLAASAAGMANLVQYVSHSVIVGFTAGAGILIAAGQIPNFLGIASSHTRNLPGILGIFERMAPHLSAANPRAIALGVAALLLILIARAISRLLPGPLLAAVGAGMVVWAMGWEDRLAIIGELPQALPRLALPVITWSTAEALIGGAMALAIVGMLEAYSIAKSIASRTGQEINPNREFLAQGMSNFVSSFFGCIPGSGSFSRSALNHLAGARTRFSGVFNSLFIAAIFLLFAPLARFIPLTSLAAILFVIAYGLVDWRYIRRVMPASRADGIVCLTTLAATLFIPLEFAIFVGIFLNIGLYLRIASRLHINEMVRMPGGRFIEIPLQSRAGARPVVFVQIEGDLFFGVADQLQRRLSAMRASEVRVAIFRLKRCHSIDSTVLDVLEQFVGAMRAAGRHVILCGIRVELAEILRNYGLIDLIGKQNVFPAGDGVFDAARKALERARHLVAASIDTAPIDAQFESEQVSYQI